MAQYPRTFAAADKDSMEWQEPPTLTGLQVGQVCLSHCTDNKLMFHLPESMRYEMKLSQRTPPPL